ncbi:hypothetical protein [Pseudovibrio sp. SPO723]|uniref:hypothetical protein n=1 Tax=Nesiotobacter zosterae TaxID=392721 RepID=UPI0029C480A3|nr:hypothetical protein [Pseudovibrio sp. SPO723]MDX5592534.1 hypothetical protein [Pseudovibrio sp. SPO723]
MTVIFDDVEDNRETCLSCGGTGYVVAFDECDHYPVREECLECEGTGFTEPYWDDEE